MRGDTHRGDLPPKLLPNLDPDTYVFCTIEGGRYGDLSHAHPLACVAEREGLTLVLPKDRADQAGLAYEGTFRRITLEAHTRLDAVGLTAIVARELADHGISANVVAGYHHDHILVPAHRADSALRLLDELSLGP